MVRAPNSAAFDAELWEEDRGKTEMSYKAQVLDRLATTREPEGENQRGGRER